MHKLIKLYNENRFVIIVIIIMIALGIIVLQTLNKLAGEERKAKLENIAKETNSSTSSQSTTISDGNTSAITGQKVKNSIANTEIIKQFVKYCNEGQVENAYNMLTDDCKERIYPSLERFKTIYYEKIFKINRMYTLENWYEEGNSATYYIKYTEDVMASGNTESKNNMSDYITVTKQQMTNCLNINSYVGTKTINKSQVQNGINIEITKIHMYMDYTILDLKVRNLSKDTIILDTKENQDTLYLYDLKGVKYTAFLNENSTEELKASKNMEIKTDIKFNKRYNPTSRDLSGLVLKDVVTNYENYTSKTEAKKAIKFDISI